MHSNADIINWIMKIQHFFHKKIEKKIKSKASGWQKIINIRAEINKVKNRKKLRKINEPIFAFKNTIAFINS